MPMTANQSPPARPDGDALLGWNTSSNARHDVKVRDYTDKLRTDIATEIEARVKAGGEDLYSVACDVVDRPMMQSLIARATSPARDAAEGAEDRLLKYIRSAPPKPAPDAVRTLIALVLPVLEAAAAGKSVQLAAGDVARGLRAYSSAPVPPADGAHWNRTYGFPDHNDAAHAPPSPSATGAAEPVADRTLWDWSKIAEAAYQRARLTDASAAAKLRSAFRAIIEAGLSATPPVRGDRETLIRVALKRHGYNDRQIDDPYFVNESFRRNIEITVDAILALPVQPAAGERERFKHFKRGTIYLKIGEAQVQAPEDAPLTDYELVTVYVREGSKPPEYWVRRNSEFNDGRFVRQPPQSSSDGGGR
jgi:hypothetical protein